MKRKNKKAFTIIELIVVLAIFALLFSIIFVSLEKSKARGRDSKREADIKEIQRGLNLYAASYHLYPICPKEVIINGENDCLSNALLNSGSMNAVPADPLRGSNGICGAEGNYVYCYKSSLDGSSYILRYALETDSIQGKSKGWHIISP